MPRSTALALACITSLVVPASAAKMTYEEAKARLGPREIPAFWIANAEGLAERLDKLKAAKVRVIAKSPGGRPVHLVAYGRREPVERRANFNSAVGGRMPTAYVDKAARARPVIYFVGPVHGHEPEGLTGLVSLIHVMETGKDLRGREQAALRELGRKCRLLIVPAGNPDGLARFEPKMGHGLTLHELQFWGMGTWADDEIAVWPRSKRQHPFGGPRVKFRGCYFNDAGINPMHDEFLDPMSSEAPAILRVAKEEGPDLAVSLHSHGNPPAVLRPAYVPLEIQADASKLAERCGALLAERGLPHAQPFKPAPEQGRIPAPFNLTSALYHVSGATAFTFESPTGITGEKWCQVTPEQLLDIQLTLYLAMIEHALEAKQDDRQP